ncbi:MAG: RNA-binding S4 domain-containing protein [Chthoniobacterales bacterium]
MSNPAEEESAPCKKKPMELCQFIKFSGITDSGGEAKQLIQDGHVMLNGVVETRRGKKLTPGDQVTLNGKTLVVPEQN